MDTLECGKLIIVWLAGAVGRLAFQHGVRVIVAEEREGRGIDALRRSRLQQTQLAGHAPERANIGFTVAPLRSMQFKGPAQVM